MEGRSSDLFLFACTFSFSQFSFQFLVFEAQNSDYFSIITSLNLIAFYLERRRCKEVKDGKKMNKVLLSECVRYEVIGILYIDDIHTDRTPQEEKLTASRDDP